MLNKAILIGHVGADPEITALPDGNEIGKRDAIIKNLTNLKDKDAKIAIDKDRQNIESFLSDNTATTNASANKADGLTIEKLQNAINMIKNADTEPHLEAVFFPSEQSIDEHFKKLGYTVTKLDDIEAKKNGLRLMYGAKIGIHHTPEIMYVYSDGTIEYQGKKFDAKSFPFGPKIKVDITV